ncbi:MAG: hypothetical protein WDN08_16250 [Rhizomicrobium sp.]
MNFRMIAAAVMAAGLALIAPQAAEAAGRQNFTLVNNTATRSARSTSRPSTPTAGKRTFWDKTRSTTIRPS